VAIDLQSRSETEDCPFCKEALVPPVTRCPECQIGLHVACAQEATRCPTLGCARNVAPVGAAAPEPLMAERRRLRRRADYRWLALLGLLLAGAALGWWRFAKARWEVARISSTPHRFPIGALAWIESDSLVAADDLGGLAVYDLKRERLAWVQGDLDSQHDELLFLRVIEPGAAVVGCSGGANLVRRDGAGWRGHFVDPNFKNYFDVRPPRGQWDWSTLELLLVPAGSDELQLEGDRTRFYGSVRGLRSAHLTGVGQEVLVGSKEGLFVSSAGGLRRLDQEEVLALVPAAGPRRCFAVLNRGGLVQVWERLEDGFVPQGVVRRSGVGVLAIDSTGRRLALGRGRGIDVVSLGGEALESFLARREVTALAFRPDGRYLASAEGDVIRVWKLPPRQATD